MDWKLLGEQGVRVLQFVAAICSVLQALLCVCMHGVDAFGGSQCRCFIVL